MAWIKRNLYFFIGSVVALALMGLAGWFLYAKWTQNNQYFDQLNTTSEELKGLNNKSPHPGNREIDNIKLAQAQQEQLRQFIKKARATYQPIPPIPDLPKVADQDFSSALIRTIVEMQQEATNSGTTLPDDYAFSFKAQKIKITFAPGSPGPLAVQLGEVKALCDVLFAARINGLENIRRERICSDDNSGPSTDYLTEKSITNDLAVLTQYEVTFRSFSEELGQVLSGFSSSPHGWVVKTLNTELAPTSANNPAPDAAPETPAYYPPTAYGGSAAMMMMARRYGGMMGGYGGGYPSAYPGTAPAAAQTPPPINRTGLPTVLDERQLKITLNVVLVKLLPGK